MRSPTEITVTWDNELSYLLDKLKTHKQQETFKPSSFGKQKEHITNMVLKILPVIEKLISVPKNLKKNSCR